MRRLNKQHLCMSLSVVGVILAPLVIFWVTGFGIFYLLGIEAMEGFGWIVGRVIAGGAVWGIVATVTWVFVRLLNWIIRLVVAFYDYLFEDDEDSQ